MHVPEYFEQLAEQMVANAAGGSFQAGYTYLGQLISHDIVPVTNPTEKGRDVSPGLNFDSIYGTKDSPAHFCSNGRFLLSKSEKMDIYRDCNDKAMIPEPRNDENILISQLHLFRQRLHNGMAKKFSYEQEIAQQYVVLVLQGVIIEDYLRQLLDENVYKLYFEDHESSRFLCLGEMPKEFSHAAFRFGHSMVRTSYEINVHAGEVLLAEMFRPNQIVPEERIVNWEFFFGLTGDRDVQVANRIDSRIAEVMTKITSTTSDVDITLTNLNAGWRAGLQNGVDFTNSILGRRAGSFYADELNLQTLDSLSGSNIDDIEGLDVTNLPLWPYLLLEAEHKFTRTGVESLGVLGSLIVADVLHTAIANSDISYFTYRNPAALFESFGEFGKLLEEEIEKRFDSDTRPLCMRDVLSVLTALET